METSFGRFFCNSQYTIVAISEENKYCVLGQNCHCNVKWQKKNLQFLRTQRFAKKDNNCYLQGWRRMVEQHPRI